jgi:predicted nucleic acid-binding protein
MILADSSVWVHHIRHGNAALVALIEQKALVCHPFVVGELACGDLPSWRANVEEFRLLPEVPMLRHDEVLMLLERHRLMASGIGWVDAHVLGSTMLAGARLWTLDKPLARAAAKLSVLAHPV